MQFQELTLDPDLMLGINDAGFASCMPVQEKTFSETLEGRDVYVQSQTGSGKTAAFLITIFEHFKRGTFQRNRALIIVPTRELAVQIEREAQLLGGHLPYRIGSFYGGVGYDKQLKLLDDDVEIVIGTPGRLIDLDQRRKLNFRDSSIVVIDEADRLFDMGFLPDLRKMLRRMPRREDRLTMLFSATLNTRVWHLAWEHMNDPVQIILNPENLTVQEVNQEVYHVPNEDKFRLLLGILEREQAENVLIFTNTKSGAEHVSRRLEFNGYQSQYIIGDLPQKKRLKLIDRMKEGDLQILVATDVAARGLHIQDLPLVVNYDLPEDPEGYVHRIGRTARAGNTGKAISLACERFVYGLESIEELIERKIPVASYDDSLLGEDKSRHIPEHEVIKSSSQQDRRPRRDDDRSSRSRDGRRGGSRSDSRRSSGGRSRTGSQGRSKGKPKTAPASTQSAGNGGGNRGSRSPQPAAASSGEKPRRSSSTPTRVSSDTSLEDRLAHYREKYGEDFKVVDSDRKKATDSGGRGTSGGSGHHKRSDSSGGGPTGDSRREKRSDSSGRGPSGDSGPNRRLDTGDSDTPARGSEESESREKRSLLKRLFGKSE